MSDINELMMNKCLEWIDGANGKEIETVFSEDMGDWHNRIYLVTETNDNYTDIQLLRVFTADNGTRSISLSSDYTKFVPTNEVHKVLGDILKTVIKVCK